MVRVNDQESSAVVRHQWCDVQNGTAELHLELDAPVSEGSVWIPGQRVAIEARWDPDSISFPPHDGLAQVLMSRSVQGAFIIESHRQVEEGRLTVTVASTGAVQPLE